MDAINLVNNSKSEEFWIEQLEALERLEANEDFRKVVLDGYLNEYALSVVRALDGSENEDVVNELRSISSLDRRFKTIKLNGLNAKQDRLDEFGE